MTFQQVLNEMAQQHIDNQVAELIINGDYDKAAERYIDNIEKAGGKIAKTSSGTTKKLRAEKYAKGLKADKELMDQITDEMWDEFDKSYKQQVGTKEGEEGKKTTTKGKAQRTKEGETEIKTSGQSQKVIKDKLEEKLVKAREANKKELQNKDLTDEQKAILQTGIDQINLMIEALRQSKKGAVLPPEKQEELKNMYGKIQEKAKKEIMKQQENEEDEEEKYSEKDAKDAIDDMLARSKGMKELRSTNQMWKDWLKSKKVEESVKKFSKELK